MKNVRKSLNEFIVDAMRVHDSKYDYSKSNYITCKDKIIIGCPLHGDFLQTPDGHLTGRGCKACKNLTLKSIFMKTIDDFILKANKVHNNLYKYNNTVYSGAFKKLKIECKIHGEFEQTADAHLAGCGCQKCFNSKGELKILNFLQSHCIPVIKECVFKDCFNPKTNKLLKFDFYIPSKKILIEFDGEQHFRPVNFGSKKANKYEEFEKLKIRDSIKTKYAYNKNIILIRIKYSDINDIENILKNIL